jgi:NAD+ synthase (glutamine-hydrolysing)
LKLYIEEDASAQDIIAAGFQEKDVRRVVSLVDGSEYKRRQSPPGIKITPRAFGKDRRMPITNGQKP